LVFIGIIVGLVVVIFGLIFAVCVLCRKVGRRPKNDRSTEQPHGSQAEELGVPMVSGSQAEELDVSMVSGSQAEELGVPMVTGQAQPLHVTAPVSAAQVGTSRGENRRDQIDMSDDGVIYHNVPRSSHASPQVNAMAAGAEDPSYENVSAMLSSNYESLDTLSPANPYEII
jgi:hypothetical protein